MFGKREGCRTARQVEALIGCLISGSPDVIGCLICGASYMIGCEPTTTSRQLPEQRGRVGRLAQ